MPDVGVLNLQIHDDSTKAAQGLDQLAVVLNRVKEAVDFGGKLGTIANNLSKLGKIIDESFQGSTIAKLNEMATALQKMKDIGKVNIRISYGKEDEFAAVAKAFEQTEAYSHGIMSDSHGIGQGFEEAGRSVAGVKTELHDMDEIIQNLNWTAGGMGEAFNRGFSAWNNMRMNRSLGSGDNPLTGFLEEAERGWTLWKDGAIEAEGTVTDAVDSISGHIEGMSDSIAGYLTGQEEVKGEWETVNSTVQSVATSTSEVTRNVHESADALEYAAKFQERVAEMAERAAEASATRQQQEAPFKAERKMYTPEETDNMASYVTSLNRLEAEVEAASQTYNRFVNTLGAGDLKTIKAAEALNKAREAVDQYRYSMDAAAKARDASVGINESNNLASTLNQYDLLTAKVTEAQQAFNELANNPNASETDVLKGAINIHKAEADVKQYLDLQEMLKKVSPDIQQFAQSQLDAGVSASTLRNKLFDLDGELKQKKTDFAAAGAEAKTFKNELDEVGAQTGRSVSPLSRIFDSVKKSLAGLGEESKKIVSPLGKLAGQFANIAKRMAMRAIIRQFTSAISEGIENVYQYSKAVGGSFAPSMNSAATALAQMKNSVGAALAPAIEALIPVLNTLVSWFITAINYVNQFFALLRGQATWIRALEYSTKAYDKSTKQAQKTAKAAKDLLADWDELNIIQSQGGGGGGGAFTPPTEYKKMFEEVAEYAKWVKDLVGMIKEQFGDVLTLVKKIGVALLGWMIASNVTGFLGMLGGLISAGAVIDLVFNIVEMFDKKFLETGDVGWLVGNVLTTLVGGFLVDSILSTVINEGAGTIGLALTFAVSAAADIKANIEDADVSALSKESIYLSVLAALKGGTAAGILMHTSGFGAGASIAGGVAGALATFGIAIALKADAQIIADDITPENVVAELIGISSLGIAGAAMNEAAATTGMGMLFSGAAITAFGVAVGVNAINTAAEAKDITKEVIEKNLLSGGLIGAGLALVAGSVIGSSAIVAIVAAGGAGIAIATLFAIEAEIAKSPAKVTWGSYNATKQEIEEFVEKELYETPPSVTISTINATLQPSAQLKESLTKSAEALLGTIYAAKIGVSTTPDELSTQVDQVIADFNAASSQYQKTLDVGLSIVPTKGANGEDASAGIAKDSAARWTELNDIMTKLGEDLADAYKVAYDAKLNGNIDENAEYTIQKISEMMTRVTEAISSGQLRAKATTTIKDQIANLSQGAMDGILQVYREQRDKLIEEMTKIRKESAEGLLSQAYAYEELARYALEDAGGKTTDETYMHYMEMAQKARDQYTSLLENLQSDVETAAEESLNKDTGNDLKNMLLNAIASPLSEDNFADALADAIIDPDSLRNAIENNMESGDMFNQDALFTNLFDRMLANLVGEGNLNTYKDAIDLGILKWSDLFNKEFIQMMKTSILGDNYSEEMGRIFDEHVSKIFGEVPKIENEVDLDTTVHETVEVVTEETQEEGNGFGKNFAPFAEYQEGLQNVKDATEETMKDLKNMKPEAPKLDTKDMQNNAGDAATSVEDMATRIRNAFQSLNGLSFSFNAGNQILSGFISAFIPPIPHAANGGIFKSGDVFSANENGNAELIGGYGNRTAVVNNDQVVGAVTNGVAQANSGVESRLGTIETLLNRILQKEFTAKAVPSASWGQHAARSADAYSKVTG